MSAIVATAPGKLLLAGEYAVLDGGPAIVAAVDRRVVARADRGAALSPFLEAAADRIAIELGSTSRAARAARRMAVDSSALRAADLKLGLGSSAAATVAAIACALAHEDGALDRALVLRLARDAHADAQGKKGARGSGADVAASTLGGVLRFAAGNSAAAGGPAGHPSERAADVGDAHVVPVALPADLVLVPFWTGHSADTADLVVAVKAARARDPQAVGSALATIAASAAALATASDAPAAIAALDAGGRALAALGAAAGLDLETAAVRAARRLSAPLGGTAKTCGAGGGDVAIAALPAGCDVASFREALSTAGCHPLDLAVDLRGVDIAAPSQ